MQSSIIKKITLAGALLSACTWLFYSCKPETAGDLGAKPKADFQVIQGTTNPNRYSFVNKSSMPAVAHWSIESVTPSGKTTMGDTAKASFIFAGNYKVTMYAAGQGGVDSITKTITVAQSDPNACQGTQLGFITSCTSKKWKLDPAAGAYNKTFVYDNKGDFFGDGYMGDNTGTCQPSSNYTATQAPWGSNTFSYSFSPNAGVAGLGQLTVIGLGAHIGLQKVRNGGENTAGPASSITYDVLAEVHDPAGYDLLTLGVNIGGGWWTFRLRSY